MAVPQPTQVGDDWTSKGLPRLRFTYLIQEHGVARGLDHGSEIFGSINGFSAN